MEVPDPQDDRRGDLAPGQNVHLLTYDSPGGRTDQQFRLLLLMTYGGDTQSRNLRKKLAQVSQLQETGIQKGSFWRLSGCGD